MADKYIIHGATYCGNGTASNEAASAGAAGAWNDINVLEGTAPAYGTAPAAGHVVAIRSKTSAGADITRTLAADVNLGSANATADNPIAWILDNGSVWSGIDGTLTYTTSNTSYNPVIIANNIVKASTVGSLIFRSTATTSIGDATWLVQMMAGSSLIGSKFDYSSHTNQAPRYAAVRGGDGVVIENPIIKAGALNSSGDDPTAAMFSMLFTKGRLTIINPDIELTNPALGGCGLFFVDNAYGSEVSVIGGRVYGAGAITGQPILSSVLAGLLGGVRGYGFEFPRAMTVSARGGTWGKASNSHSIEFNGCDDGVGGYIEQCWGWATSRTDNNPPTLSATLPDADSSPWAWRVYPAAASALYPMRLTTTKLYVDSAASRTVSQEILVADTMAPNKKTLWITVEYIDNATGLPKHLSSRDFSGAALDTSTANWSATVWGMVALEKRKFEIETPTAIKPNTLITVSLCGIVKSTTANDIYFVDPDFGVN